MNNYDSLKSLKPLWRETLLMNVFSRLKIPLLGACNPVMLDAGEDRTVIKFKLARTTKNHLGGMYFGALSMGGEAAVAMKAVLVLEEAKKRGHKVDFIFKDFKANFLRRSENHVYFVSDSGRDVVALAEKAIQSGQRETQTFKSVAVVHNRKGQPEVTAEFEVTLSLKKRTPKN
jgi:hypothetical protein